MSGIPGGDGSPAAQTPPVSRTKSLWLAVVIVATVLAAIGPTPISVATDDAAGPVDLQGILFERPTGELVSDELDRLLSEGAASPERGGGGSRVTVEAVTSDPARVAAIVAELGGQVLGTVEGELVLAEMPRDALVRLERAASVRYLRPPNRADLMPPSSGAPAVTVARDGGVVGYEVVKTNADAWHAFGRTGEGVKVGIIDGFHRGAWKAAKAAGEVPGVAGRTFCRRNGATCGIFSAGSAHGVAVAEIVHEMAPNAELYIATGYTIADLQAIVEWFDSQDVDIITRSLLSVYDGPGDGTGPTAAVVADAVDRGMLFINAVGNAAGEEGRDGSYLRVEWTDDDGDGIMAISYNGQDEVLQFSSCTDTLGLRWSDWGEGNKTDLDVYVADTIEDLLAGRWEAISARDQRAGADPVEWFPWTCSGPGDIDHMVINTFHPGADPYDLVEFMMNGLPVENPTNRNSAAVPAVDSASSGMIAVGAVDPAEGVELAPYSSRGPTNDGRMKPDLLAAACVQTFTFAPQCFRGTNSSAPTVAGAAALVIGSGIATTPAEVRSWLITEATPREVFNNAWGYGELELPDPPVDTALRVRSVILTLKEDRGLARARIDTELLNGLPVGGVEVTGEWLIDGLPQGVEVEVAKLNGVAFFDLHEPPPGAALEFCVRNLHREDYQYLPDQDAARCAGATWPDTFDHSLHVTDIWLDLKPERDRVFGRVFVADEDGDPVRGAEVTGYWTVDGVPEDPETRNTISTGSALFRHAFPAPGSEVEFCVSDIFKGGYVYDPAANDPTCAAVVGQGVDDEPAIHVADVRIVSHETHNQAMGRVFVEDSGGNPIQGVAVSARWAVDGVEIEPGTKRTNPLGIAVFRHDDPVPGTALEVCVLDMTSDGYAYDEPANEVTCASRVWPGG